MFIKQITFPKNQFYNDGNPIEFGNTQASLIDFYLNTTRNNAKQSGKTLQINCILGDNGAGKTRFFREISDFFPQTNNKIDGDFDIRSNNRNEEKPGKTIVIVNNSNDYSYKRESENSIFDREVIKTTPHNLSEDKIHLIIDDFFAGSCNISQSINRIDMYDMLTSGGLSTTSYLKMYNLLHNQSESIIKETFSAFLHLEDNAKSGITIETNIDWYTNFSGDHLEFIESEGKGGLKGFINEELFRYNQKKKEEIFEIFQYFYARINNPEQSKIDYPILYDIIDEKLSWKYWNVLSDLFIALMNEYRNHINFVTGSEIYNFVKLDGYKEFQEILIMLEFFLAKNESGITISNLNEAHFLSQEHTKICFQQAKTSIQYILKIFGEIKLDKDLKKQQEAINQLTQSYFGLSTHEFLRHISGYEKNHVGASDYFFLVLATGFQKEGEEKNKKIARTLQWVFYYLFRNPDQQNIRENAQSFKRNYSGSSAFNQNEQTILSFPFFKTDLEFKDDKNLTKFSELSAGEKSILLRFSNIATEIENQQGNGMKHFVILIDEPDLHLHLDWQRQYIQKLINVFSIFPNEITLQFILATHSPFIVSDLPAENIIRMKKEDNNSVKFEQYSESKKSFGANYVDIIQTGFFDNELLMGSFAHEVIKMLSLAEKNDILGENFKWNKDTKNAKKYIQNEENRGNIKRMKNEIGDEFLKSHLLYFK